MIPAVIFILTTSVSLGCFVLHPGWPAASMSIVSMAILGTLLMTAFDDEMPPPKDSADSEELKKQLETLSNTVQQMKSQSNLVAAFSPRK